jgi:hypothetical protein
MSSSNLLYVGMDVHKDSVMLAVFSEHGAEPSEVRRVANEPRKLRRFFERLGREGQVRACYEASGAGSTTRGTPSSSAASSGRASWC